MGGGVKGVESGWVESPGVMGSRGWGSRGCSGLGVEVKDSGGQG